MQEPSRRSLLKNAATVAAAVTGGAMLTNDATAQATGKLEKKKLSCEPAWQKAALFKCCFLRQFTLSFRSGCSL